MMATCEREVRIADGSAELCEYHYDILPGGDPDFSVAQTVIADESDDGEREAPSKPEPSESNTSAAGRGPENIDLESVNHRTYPEDLVDNGARWLLWQDSDGRKVPRNPRWGRSDRQDGYAYVGAKNPDAWFEFQKAHDWITHEDGLGLAYYLTGPDRTDWDDDPSHESIDPEQHVPDEPHVGLLDFDDIRDLDTGEVAPEAVSLLDQLSGTFCEWSPSGTGAHALGGFRLPDNVSTLTIDLSSADFPDAELEIYPGHRYTTVTGDHIPGTATQTRDIQGIVDGILAEHPGAVEGARASTVGDRPTELTVEPTTSKEDLAAIDTTADIQEVFDAIQHTDPSDIQLRSTVTHDRGDGSKDLDPSWAQSKSGTRLTQVAGGWVYRKGMVGLDALQVVALEKRIISSVTTYPSGEDFWDAVAALRDRGAHIPEYESESYADDPVSTLPLEALDSLNDEQRNRAAAERDIDWPSTAEARTRLRDRILDAFSKKETTVIDAPTSLGKSFTVATEPWLRRADVTGEQPVVHLSPTRASRDEAAEHSHEASGVTHAVLRGQKRRVRWPMASMTRPIARRTTTPSQ